MQLGWFLRLPSLHVLVFLLKTFCGLFLILSIATVPIMNAVKNGKLDGNDTTTLSHHPYILCHLPPLAQICFVFVGCVQRRVVEGSGVGSGGCVAHFDVHGE